MSRVTTHVAVSPRRALAVLEDPRSLRLLVAGARRIRRFDPQWPEPGSKIHHTVGFGPLSVRDTTEVILFEPGRRLVLEARVQMLGTFRVTFEVEQEGDATRLLVDEAVEGGLLAFPPLRPLMDLAITLRNKELARRYERLVERREAAAGG